MIVGGAPRRLTAWRALICLTAVAVAVVCPAGAATRPAQRAHHAMVVGPEPLAVEEGLKILAEGGNAVDAPVTIGFVLAVTHPQAGNIGGGGFMLIRSSTGETAFIDYRETAPAAASRNMFLDPNGDVVPGASTRSYLAAGVPGTIAGLALALERYGTIPLRRALAPAVRLARSGFSVSRGLEESLASAAGRLGSFPTSRRVFFKGDAPLAEGDLLVQRDLSRTLETVSRGGPRAFYEGEPARALAAEMKQRGGLITFEDLRAYRPVVREPLRGTYHSLELISAPPPSSGGVALIEMLNMLEPFDLGSLGHNSSAYVHVVSEAMKRAYADRAQFLGDPDAVGIPLAALISKPYALALMRGFDPGRATPAKTAGPGDPTPFESPSTTHFSVIDDHGGIVANTYTLNDSFGSGAVAGTLGFLLNNEMDDFSVKPGVPNLYGLVGGEANSIAPGKRMLSSMTPTLAIMGPSTGGGRAELVLGTPGGSTIITTVLQVLLNVVEFKMELQEAVDAPRFHHQWLPDEIRLDAGGFPMDVQAALRERGHVVTEGSPRGDVQAILVDPSAGWIYGASDARGQGAARGR